MANGTVVDVNEEAGLDVTQLVNDLTEATHEVPKQKQELGVESKPAERPAYIEEKYWTGDVEESLGKQHEGFKKLQSRYGQMANDLGVQRQLADQLIGLKRESDLRGVETPQQAPLPKITASSLLEKPDAALDEYLSAREARLSSAYEARIQQLESQLTGVQLQSKHGDYDTLVNDPEWKEWLVSDPARAHKAQLAANGDQIIADELITQYKQSKKATTPAPEAKTTPQVEERAKPPAVPDAAKHALASAASQDSGTRGKIYSRAALMRLKATQPDVYEDPSFQDEIIRAYQDGRVK